MNENAIEVLKKAGVEVDKLSEAHREVLANLSQRELDTLLEIKKRFDDASAGEVEGYLCEMGDGPVFY